MFSTWGIFLVSLDKSWECDQHNQFKFEVERVEEYE